MTITRATVVTLALWAGSVSPAAASCNDVRKTCHDAYIRDLGGCDKSYAAGADRDACQRRAEQQHEHCVKAGGCG